MSMVYNVIMNFNPDNIKIERHKRFSENIEMQNKYLAEIEKRALPYTPKEENFKNLYSPEEIQKDLKLVALRKKQFKENQTEQSEKFKRISDIYEGIIVEQAEQNAWFGNNVTFYPTSKYDDIVNGVDGVAEFFSEEGNKENKHMAMSFDVVFSSDSERILKKLERTKNSIRNGKLTEVKYFEDEEGNQSSLRAPRIVLGSRLASAESLINLWGGKSKDKNKKLAKHPIQIKLLLEAYLQLGHFAKYAHSIGNNDIAMEYGIVANKIVEIINEEKEGMVNEYYDDISDDIVFETIKNYCNSVEL